MSKKSIKLMGAFILALLAFGFLKADGVQATTINSLDYALLNNPTLECGILKETNIKRENKTTLDYLVTVFEDQYFTHETFGTFADLNEQKEAIIDTVKNDWSTFVDDYYADMIIEFFHADEGDNLDVSYYQEMFREELADEYYKIMIVTSIPMIDSNIDLMSLLYNIYYGVTYDISGNMCSEDPQQIDTTYGSNGYTTFLKINGEQILGISEEGQALQPFVTETGYLYHQDNSFDLNVDLSRVDETTVKATYTFKNLSSAAATYGLGVYTDVEFGDNDDAAVKKTDDSFTITQDDDWYVDTFGAQFHIVASPKPTTTFIGEYYTAMEKIWQNSSVDHITRADGIDSGLAYSWQGQINPGETKVYTATYSLKLAETMDNSFYFLEDDGVTHESTPSFVVPSIDGGALDLPVTPFIGKKGYNRKWNTKSDGTGRTYDSAETVVASIDTPNYYEIEVTNIVRSLVGKNDLEAEDNIVLEDKFIDAYQGIADETYRDVDLEIDIDYADEDDLIEYGVFTEDEIYGNEEGFETREVFFLYGAYYYSTDENDHSNRSDIEEELYPLPVRVKFPNDSGIEAIKLYEMPTTEGPIVEIPVTYNPETGEFFFEMKKPGEDIYYKLSVKYEEIKEPEILVPSTGKFTIFDKGSTTAVTTNALTTAAILTLIMMLTAHRTYKKR